MKRAELQARRRIQTLTQLEACDWGPPDADSYLVQTCHRLRHKPIGEFTVEELRMMIGQNIGAYFLVPLALETLAVDPLAEGDYYPGDLLASVLTLPSEFWKTHIDLQSKLNDVISRMVEIPDLLLKPIKSYHSTPA